MSGQTNPAKRVQVGGLIDLAAHLKTTDSGMSYYKSPRSCSKAHSDSQKTFGSSDALPDNPTPSVGMNSHDAAEYVVKVVGC